MLNLYFGVARNCRGALGKRSPEKEWVRIRSAILRVLDRFPDARGAVVEALVELRAVDEGDG